jgi:TIR domain
LAGGAPNGPDVFLSYAGEDEARARELATALGQSGFSVFWDREIPPGQTWHSYIGEALANARCVVVAWSRHSIASQWVLEEASEGRDRKVLVPVLFEAVQPPFGFRAIQAANLTDWRPSQPSPAFDSLLRAVNKKVGGQAGSGTELEAEVEAPPPPAPSEPETKSKPSVGLPTPPSASRERRAEPMMPPNGRAGAWTRPTMLAMLVGFVVIAGAGGTALLWWRTQPEPTTPDSVTEAQRQIPPPASSEPRVEPETRPATPPRPP